VLSALRLLLDTGELSLGAGRQSVKKHPRFLVLTTARTSPARTPGPFIPQAVESPLPASFASRFISIPLPPMDTRALTHCLEGTLGDSLARLLGGVSNALINMGHVSSGSLCGTGTATPAEYASAEDTPSVQADTKGLTRSEGGGRLPTVSDVFRTDVADRYIKDVVYPLFPQLTTRDGRGFVERQVSVTVEPTPSNAGNELVIRAGSKNAYGHSSSLSMPILSSALPSASNPLSPYICTPASSRLVDTFARAITACEPVLLVGETGIGKTAVVQALAKAVGIPLSVNNLSQQTDVADLLGGFKPVTADSLVHDVSNRMIHLLSCLTLSASKEGEAPLLQQKDKILTSAYKALSKRGKNYKKKICNLCNHAMKLFQQYKDLPRPSGAEGDRERESVSLQEDGWMDLKRVVVKLHAFLKTSSDRERAKMFHFVEGSMVRALREGHWILLDEINLASSEVLHRIGTILNGATGSITLAERGDNRSVRRHPNFRLIGVMNPPTDVGKKELPTSVRSRFSEIYVHELSTKEDLSQLVTGVLNNASVGVPVPVIVDTYLGLREMSGSVLKDAEGQKPIITIRSLCRALSFTKDCLRLKGMPVRQALYEGFVTAFLTTLDIKSSRGVADAYIRDAFFTNKAERNSNGDGYRDWIQHIPKGPHSQTDDGSYVVTESLSTHLRDVASAVMGGRFPILLQGATSTGKTSLVAHLAKLCGHTFVRINNHEHTDLEEYLGTYVPTESGGLRFEYGVLATAVKNGHWLVLDELNLAPSEVLEALNRLLDDNRELHIPETNETMKPHPNFRLFATQNPAGVYSGRKPLSRAFRNRFGEVHFSPFSEAELKNILERRTRLIPKHCTSLIKLLGMLSIYKGSKAFSGMLLITLRDLFRIGERCPQDDRDLAFVTWCVLGERVRDAADQQTIIDAIQKCTRYRVVTERERESTGAAEVPENETPAQRRTRERDRDRVIDLDSEYSALVAPLRRCLASEPVSPTLAEYRSLAWTKSFTRLCALSLLSLRADESPLLVGGTGCGKTTVVTLLAAYMGRSVTQLNCHEHTETSDLIGSLRPNRRDGEAEAEEDEEGLSHALFSWVDGPLVSAMKRGDHFLIDEISLAGDSVLERLNSVLEPSREITIAERPTSGDEDVVSFCANPSFRIIATMNPGGDYGKRELSPALRNRLTEVWCPQIESLADFATVLLHRVNTQVVTPTLIDCAPNPFTVTFTADMAARLVSGVMAGIRHIREREAAPIRDVIISIRDVLVMSDFAGAVLAKWGDVSVSGGSDREALLRVALVEGLELAVIGPLPVRTQMNPTTCTAAKARILEAALLGAGLATDTPADTLGVASYVEGKGLSVGRFYIHDSEVKTEAASAKEERKSFAFEAPTTSYNAVCLGRAYQIERPVLMEGAPGVGKTALITNIASVTGHTLVRINLSDQTDLCDLIGTDLPTESGGFGWCDGPLLTALREGHWVLLDELNLAPQPVLEGLNSILDHRKSIYVPGLDETVIGGEGFRIFATQNPMTEVSGRKGLPQSFLNRFTAAYLRELEHEDRDIVVRSLYPELTSSALSDKGADLSARLCHFCTEMADVCQVHWIYTH
ncbi:midasin, partial [Kipferlia bialata]